jgi:hypothetical protein
VVRRYPPAVILTAERESRVHLGQGAVLDLYPSADQRGIGSAWLTYGDVWIHLAGLPAPPQSDTKDGTDDGSTLLAAVSREVWPDHLPPLWLSVGKAEAGQALIALDRPREAVLDLVTDGSLLWPVGSMQAQ